MTDKEICEEIYKDKLELDELFNRYYKKNRSIEKNNGIKDKTILVDKELVTKRHNTVRFLITKVKDVEYNYGLYYASMFKMVGNNGQYIYFIPNPSKGNLIKLSSHFTDRIRERGGMTVQDFFRKVSYNLCPILLNIIYYEGYKDWTELFDGLAFYEEKDYITTLITWVSNSMLSEGQNRDAVLDKEIKNIVVNKLIEAA